ncbi:MAG: tRNA dihydrouridine(20/20a) synthase DusA [Steroidobacteraceae bacterium]|nr:tRNA dihydrouridine(20/20a) synthase DusA [Steroidobacteraceae bacterium]MCC7198270.1 tRNA dihydrouridine(20/20a) synthase DusA [Gammaproteobacteria bacterium]
MLDLDRKVSVAPMMDWTDRHCRYFLRLFSPEILLYTEMVVAQAILRGDREYLLGYDRTEHPVALQLGGSDPRALAEAARIGEDFGYDEINLNVGCPSDRVREGTFGACLMDRPRLVADCVAAMRDSVSVPVTVKTRIGIDDRDDYDFLCDFIDKVSAAGCEVFIIHARKAILTGLTPKENREIPPLIYQRAWDVKNDYPLLTIVINGGLKTVADCEAQWQHVDGVMLGREAYHNPGVLGALHRAAFGDDGFVVPTSAEVVRMMRPYTERQLVLGQRLQAIARHMLGLFAGQPGARAWRRALSEGAHHTGAGWEVVERALTEAHRD